MLQLNLKAMLTVSAVTVLTIMIKEIIITYYT